MRHGRAWIVFERTDEPHGRACLMAEWSSEPLVKVRVRLGEQRHHPERADTAVHEHVYQGPVEQVPPRNAVVDASELRRGPVLRERLADA